MTDKDLRKLNRIELLELFLEQCKRNEALEQELSDVKAELDSKNAKISNAGSLAEASLALTNIFEEAQKAADLYLANVRGMTAEDQEEAIREFLREIRENEADSQEEADSQDETDSPYEEDPQDEADSLPKRTEAGIIEEADTTTIPKSAPKEVRQVMPSELAMQEAIVVEDIDLSDMVEAAAAAKPIDPDKREEDVEAWIRNHQVPEKYRVREEFVEDEYDEEYDDEDFEVEEYEVEQYDEEYDDEYEVEQYDEIIDEVPNDELTDEEIAVEEIAYEQNEGVMRPIIPTNEAVTIKVRQAPIRQLSPSRVKRPYSAVGFRKPKPVKPMLSKNVRNAVK